jgi:hypothetical protein
MKRVSRDARLWMVVSIGIVVLLAATPAANTRVHAGAAATPTPYHEGVPGGEATPHAMEPTLYPLPAAEDRASADAMAAGGAAMIEMARAMDEAAALMLESGDPQLVALGQHWVLDAQALQRQAAWMVLSATAADMVHDPATAHEINARNLKGNGLAMAAEGRAMAEHGRAMTAQVDQLLAAGAISPDLAEQLVTAGEELVATGEALQRDGQRMQEFADDMLALIGG